jgi:hypothetical protein
MTDKDDSIPRHLTKEYWDSRPFKPTRKPASPRVSDFERQVIKNADKMRREKGISIYDILPFNRRYWRLLLEHRRTLYAMTLFLLAEGLDCSIDDLVVGCEDLEF